MYSAILYHGTKNREQLIREGFKERHFLSGRGVMAQGQGFYACPTIAQARRYGEVVKVQVTLMNPYKGEFFKRFRFQRLFGRIHEITEILRSEGYDGAILKGMHDEVLVFDAKNIKVLA